MYIPFDIETIPAGNIEDVEVRVPANYKKQETIDKYIEENREAEFLKRGLSGSTCEIVSVGYFPLGYDDHPHMITRTPTRDKGEKWLLECFATAIQGWMEVAMTDSQGRDGDVILVGHNIIDFDLRVLWQRCVVNGVQMPFPIRREARTGHGVIDTMKEWSGTYNRSEYIKQDALYELLGGKPINDPDENGSMVYQWWLDGKASKIAEYNKVDVLKAAHIFTRMRDFL